MLGNKRSNGAVGRRYFTWNNQVVDGKGKGINDPTSKFNSRSLKKFGLKQLAYIQLKGCYKKDSERVGYYSCIGEGAPHIRQRLYWVADSINKGSQGRLSGWQDQEREIVSGHAGCSGTVGGLSDTENGYGGGEPQLATSNVGESWDQSGGNGACGGLVYTDGARPQQGRESTEATGHRNTIESTSGIDGLANTFDIINERKIGGIHAEKNSSQTLNGENINKPRESIRAGSNDGWSNPDWLYCRDEKYRPIRHGINPLARTVKSSSFKMANGLPRGVGYSSDPSEPIDPDNTQEARVMRLKGYGNAIVPQVAASFIKAFMEAT
jgi:DNA (cytosine-5)-methyltransferase 1